MQIIGIDCATSPKGMGLARGRLQADRVVLEAVCAGSTHASNLEYVAKWLNEDVDTLLCLDAPLGWPRPLGRVLAGHRAGDGIDVVANDLFRRATDRDVKDRLNKQSLDVGADRIARTAHAALGFLVQLRRLTGLPLPLGWTPSTIEGAVVIEVYPAATLVAHGYRSLGYKKPENRVPRREILDSLGSVLTLPEDMRAMEDNADALDAAVCVLAGADFLRNLCPGPDDRTCAEIEGWIWVRS